MAQLGDRLDNSLGDSTTNRLDNRAADRTGCRLVNRLGSRPVNSPILDQLVRRTAIRVELKLSLNQQVGDTRRGVTDVARRGTRGTKATTKRQSNSPRSSPSGKMRPTSKHRQKMRTWENRTQDGTWTDSTTCKFPPFLAPLYKTLMHYLLINNLL